MEDEKIKPGRVIAIVRSLEHHFYVEEVRGGGEEEGKETYHSFLERLLLWSPSVRQGLSPVTNAKLKKELENRGDPVR